MGEFIDKNKGKIKQAIADLTGNEKLKKEGEKDVRKGRAKGAIKEADRAVKAALK